MRCAPLTVAAGALHQIAASYGRKDFYMNYSEIYNEQFKNAKRDWLPDNFRSTIEGFIDRFHFARDMRSCELWQKIDEEANWYCFHLADLGCISRDEAQIIYGYIKENAERPRF